MYIFWYTIYQCFGSGQFQTGSGSGSPFFKKPDPDPGSGSRIQIHKNFVNQFISIMQNQSVKINWFGSNDFKLTIYITIVYGYMYYMYVYRNTICIHCIVYYVTVVFPLKSLTLKCCAEWEVGWFCSAVLFQNIPNFSDYNACRLDQHNSSLKHSMYEGSYNSSFLNF